MTYSYVILPVSKAAFDEIAGKLRAAGYDQAFHDEEDGGLVGLVIDMHGLALQVDHLVEEFP